MVITALLYAISPIQWEKIVRNIAEHLPQWKLGNEQRDFGIVNQTLVQLGYRKPGSYDFDGIECASDSIARIRGADGFLVLLRGPQPDQRGCTALFLRKGRSFSAEILESSDSAYCLDLPMKATLTGNKLLIASLYDWFGNWPRTSLRLFEREKRWRKLSTARTDLETCSISGIYPTLDGKGFKPIGIVSRTYPKNLSCSHASAMTSVEEQWTVVENRLRFDWKKLRSTAFNALDKLYGALAAGDYGLVRSYCANTKVAQKIWSVRSRTILASPYVDDLDRRFLDTTEIGVANLRLAFHFNKLHGRFVVVKTSSYEAEW